MSKNMSLKKLSIYSNKMLTQYTVYVKILQHDIGENINSEINQV